MGVTASKTYNVILIDGKDSSGSPRGEKGAFPIKDIIFPKSGSQVNLSNDKTFVDKRYPLFVTYDLTSGENLDEVGAELVADLQKILEELTAKQSPTKCTLVQVVNQVKDGALDVTKYDRAHTVELDKATIHMVAGTTDTYQIQADKAIEGTGDKAASKNEIDYKNRV